MSACTITIGGRAYSWRALKGFADRNDFRSLLPIISTFALSAIFLAGLLQLLASVRKMASSSSASNGDWANHRRCSFLLYGRNWRLKIATPCPPL